MSKHQHDPNANELFFYFRAVAAQLTHCFDRRQATHTPLSLLRRKAFISRASGATHTLLWSPSGDTYSPKFAPPQGGAIIVR